MSRSSQLYESRLCEILLWACASWLWVLFKQSSERCSHPTYHWCLSVSFDQFRVYSAIPLAACFLWCDVWRSEWPAARSGTGGGWPAMGGSVMSKHALTDHAESESGQLQWPGEVASPKWWNGRGIFSHSLTYVRHVWQGCEFCSEERSEFTISVLQKEGCDPDIPGMRESQSKCVRNPQAESMMILIRVAVQNE